MKYQTKPVEVDAVQWFKDGDDQRVAVDNTIFIAHSGGKYIKPRSGWFPIKPSNWIVTYSNGRVEVYNNDEFMELFEKSLETPILDEYNRINNNRDNAEKYLKEKLKDIIIGYDYKISTVYDEYHIAIKIKNKKNAKQLFRLIEDKIANEFYEKYDSLIIPFIWGSK